MESQELAAGREYVCAACGNEYISTVSGAEAEAGMRLAFGNVKKEDQVTVCDDCYRIVMQHLARIN